MGERGRVDMIGSVRARCGRELNRQYHRQGERNECDLLISRLKHFSSFLDSAVNSERATLIRATFRVAPVSVLTCYKMVAKIPVVMPVS
jgi:hypothetical protein